ncbi:MAG: RNA-binding protein [Pseudoclavibacter sp.]|nr:RNA-binding protein [Pseudoclavibacter sp.]
MGLIHPRDLAAWQRWQDRQAPLVRRLRRRLRPAGPPQLRLHLRGEEPRLLVALESASPSSVAANLRILERLSDLDLAILAPAGLDPALLDRIGGAWIRQPAAERPPERLGGLRAVLASGHFLPAGARCLAWARAARAPFLVAQHGLITPHTPPLPRDSTLLAFSAEDGEFWRSGRDDVVVATIGSQLFWDAAAAPRRRIEGDAAPVFLGQLHGAELPYRGQLRRAIDFCRRTGADYRPHPAERDRRSRAGHRRLRAAGVRVDARPLPLAELARPVVAAFSTGIVEAAALGLPAWVSYADPPGWLRELWERYRLSPYGREPTPPPVQPRVEPLRAAAELIRRTIGAAP